MERERNYGMGWVAGRRPCGTVIDGRGDQRGGPKGAIEKKDRLHKTATRRDGGYAIPRPWCFLTAHLLPCKRYSLGGRTTTPTPASFV